MSNSIPALITPAILKWARELDNISIEEIAAKMKLNESVILSWENGCSYPTLVQAKKLAKQYRVPFAYFYLPDEPKKVKRLDKIDYRTFGNSGNAILSRELRWFLRDIEDRRDSILELYKENEWAIPSSVIIDAKYNSEEELANYLRLFMGYTAEIQLKFRNPEAALHYAVSHLEDKGFLIFQTARIQTDEMRGLSIAYKEFPIIALNRKDEPSARLFTLFHELVHIITNTSGICNQMLTSQISQNKIEMFCNNVAGLALVPGFLLKNHLGVKNIKEHGFKDTYVIALARDFAVSKEVILNRLWKIGLITQTEYFNILKRYSDEYLIYKQTKKKEGFITPAIDKGTQVGKLYSRAVLTAYHNERISSLEASHYLLGLRIQHFEKLERWCF